MTEDFSNAPLTIGELRGEKTGEAKDWAPRDILISYLRAIDAGEIKPDSLLIVWAGDDRHGWKYSTGLRLETAIGLLEMAKIEFAHANMPVLNNG